MEAADDNAVMYAGVGSQSDLGSNKGLQAKGTVRDNKFQLLAGSIIAPAAPSLNKKYTDLRAAHLEQGRIAPSGGGCFRVVQDLAFDSASQAFIYAYGTNPPGGKLTWTPPSGPGRVVRKHVAAVASSPKQMPKNEKDTKKEKEKEKENYVDDDNEEITSDADEVEVPARMQIVDDHEDDEDEDEDESQLRPPSRTSGSGLKVVQLKREQVESDEDDSKDDDEEEELSEVDAELAYIEAKIRLLQIRKKKLLQKANTGTKSKPLARKLQL